jgi:hypothetical protein
MYVYIKFSSLSETSEKGVPVLATQHASVSDETMLNTKPVEAKTNYAKTKVLCSEK